MFKLVYARGVLKDLRKIAPSNLPMIKKGIEELAHFPDLAQIKQLKNHSVADFRLRVGNYRILFDVDWNRMEIQILKVDGLVKSP